MNKATPIQNIEFQCYLIQRAGYAEIADLGRKAISIENWNFLYKMADDLEKPKGKLDTTTPLVDQDIIHNIRLALNSIILKEMPDSPQPETPPPPANVPQPRKEEDDDNLQPA